MSELFNKYIILYKSQLIVSGRLEPKELDRLRSELRQYDSRFSPAKLYSSDPKKAVNLDIRSGFTCSIKPGENNYMYNFLQSLIISNYIDVYDNLGYEIPVELQYTYYRQGNYFKKHQDVVGNDDFPRSLTLSLNLSEPSEYHGGVLRIYNGDQEIQLDRAAGSWVIFPSFILHQADPVTEGDRYAIVAWLHSSGKQLNDFKKAALA